MGEICRELREPRKGALQAGYHFVERTGKRLQLARPSHGGNSFVKLLGIDSFDGLGQSVAVDAIPSSSPQPQSRRKPALRTPLLLAARQQVLGRIACHQCNLARSGRCRADHSSLQSLRLTKSIDRAHSCILSPLEWLTPRKPRKETLSRVTPHPCSGSRPSPVRSGRKPGSSRFPRPTAIFLTPH